METARDYKELVKVMVKQLDEWQDEIIRMEPEQLHKLHCEFDGLRNILENNLRSITDDVVRGFTWSAGKYRVIVMKYMAQVAEEIDGLIKEYKDEAIKDLRNYTQKVLDDTGKDNMKVIPCTLGVTPETRAKLINHELGTCGRCEKECYVHAEVNGIKICNMCLYDLFSRCTECEEHHPRNETHDRTTHNICDDCLEKMYTLRVKYRKNER